MKSNNGIKLLLLLLIGVGLGCYENEEGCLDVTATNFSVSADSPCEDCCTYPQLKLAFRHRAGLTNPDTLVSFSYDSIYTIAGFTDVPIRFQRIKFYLSDFKLVQNGTPLGVSDVITLTSSQDGSTFNVSDNFALVDRDIFANNTLGLFANPGSFESIQFTIGLEPEIQATDASTIAGGHPLSIQSDSLNWEEGLGYVPNKIVYFPDTTANTDSTVLRLYTPIPVSITPADPIEIESGFDVVITLQVDYLDWFAGVDMSTRDKSGNNRCNCK